MNEDGLVKSPIYVVVGRTQQFAVPYVLPNCRVRHYASYIELSAKSALICKAHLYEPKHDEFLRIHQRYRAP